MKLNLYVATGYPATPIDLHSSWTIGVYLSLKNAVAHLEEFFENTFKESDTNYNYILEENEALVTESTHPYIRRIQRALNDMNGGGPQAFGGLFVDIVELDISSLELLAMAGEE